MMTQFFEATTDAILFLNREYVFTFVNRRAREILSPSGELLGRSLWESYPAAAQRDSPYWTHYHRTMDAGETTEFEAYYPAPLDLWLHVHSYPSDEGIIVFFRDVTQEKVAREALRRKSEEAEHQLAEIEAVYRTAPIGLALFDLDDYHYVRLNDRQAAFFGLTPEQIVGKTLIQMAPIEGLRELFDQVAQGGPPVVNYPLEGTLATDPHDYRYWTVSYYPVLGADGQIQGITAASLEITAQKKAEQALIESDKLAAVGRLAASIAHEINNPLESVTNLLYLAKTSTHLEDALSYLHTAENELQRVAAITTDTLRFHKQSTSPQAITGEQLFDGVLSIYQGRLANSGVMVEERHRSPEAVRCFEGEIRQVISNLVSNALDAMSPGGGRLKVRSRKAVRWATGEGGLVLTVADTGSGVPAEILQKIFKPFYTTKGAIGTGLGLWVSQEIVDRHRGVMRVRSCTRPEHSGTVFSVFLPFEAATR
jgi:signal transduction histidine kinase